MAGFPAIPRGAPAQGSNPGLTSQARSPDQRVGHSRVRALPCTQWEDLRTALQQQTGSSPQMPGKMLFGRMRPEVIESRVVGLDNFLQLCMVTPLYASCPVLTDFLTRGMDAPPPGLDLVDLGEAKFDAQAARGGGRAWSRVGVGARAGRAQVRRACAPRVTLLLATHPHPNPNPGPSPNP